MELWKNETFVLGGGVPAGLLVLALVGVTAGVVGFMVGSNLPALTHMFSNSTAPVATPFNGGYP